MKAVILAAGVASRLRPLTDNTPKCLLNICGKTILERTVSNILDNGIDDFIIVTGFLKEKIENHLSEKFPELNVKYIFNDVFNSTNNIYSLWLTKDFMIGDEMLLLDSDILFNKQILKLLLESPYNNCLAVKSGFKLSEEEIKVTVSMDGSIKEISKVVDPADAVGESIGIEKFGAELTKELFKILDYMILKENKKNIFYEAAFEKAINDGAKIFPVDVGKLKCVELDTVEDVKFAQEKVIDGLD
ncbi:MAG: phosphocholine cytidylyltransferase family protein [Melioribacteraceae bacterium]|nr:phosphocholine cytidylyltransferase family protein [Melioribacteraceae bacterium]